jgi:hypothetical protein
MSVDVTRQAAKDSPVWNPARVLDRDYEARLHAHYDIPAYWPESSAQP